MNMQSVEKQLLKLQLLLLFKIISRTKHWSLTVQYFTRVFTNHAETYTISPYENNVSTIFFVS